MYSAGKPDVFWRSLEPTDERGPKVPKGDRVPAMPSVAAWLTVGGTSHSKRERWRSR